MKSMRMVHENVEKIRVARGITKTHLAGKLGLSLQGYRHIANGNVELNTERLRVIATVFCLTDFNIFFDEQLTDRVIKEIEDIDDHQRNKVS